jgi:YidC/Oxa1 family membrane protein insertase
MNNNPRIFLWIGLILVLWLNYEAWVRDYGEKPQPSAAVAPGGTANGSGTTPSGLDSAIPQSNGSAAATSSAAAVAGGSPAPDAGVAAATDAGKVHVVTDVFDLDISLRGGELERADLNNYPLIKGGAQRVRLLNRDSPQTLYVLQSGLSGPAGANRPTHLAHFAAENPEYHMQDGQRELRVPLRWTDGQGVSVTKTFVFTRGLYSIGLDYRIDNHGSEPWPAAAYAQIFRHNVPIARSMFSVESYAFKGPAIHDGTKYRKLKLDNDDDRKLSLDVRGGWLAALEHHFVSAAVPAADAINHYALNVQGVEYTLSAVGPTQSITPGASAELKQAVYVGPKLQAQLEATAPNLERVADYGVLTILAKPLFWLLGKLHALVGNWGWAIILATFILKLAFYPLSEASGKSMGKMKTLQPRIKALQETYKDDREKLGKAMMELYQREKINPVAGCLPILIQMPVFLAFYWVLLESVEMRQAPFMGWLNDLSARDPYFILPAIMAGAMFLQYKLNPAPPDPVQQKVFMIMPLAMSAMFAFFPSGLVLYWVTNTILSIAQQWNINRRIGAATAKR